MSVFHVFVEGATDGSPAGVVRLAQAIAAHYGLPAPDLLARLQYGRFRVKGNIDRATAEQFARDLEKLGARCAIEPATAHNSQRATPVPFPAVQSGTPPLSPPPPTAQPPTQPPGRPSFQSGLAAAFSGETPAASLGALDQAGAAFALASVDGADADAPSASSSAPAGDALPASIGPAAKPASKPVTKPAKPKDVPLDLFAPPDAQGEEFKVNIADDELEVSARKRASTPPPDEDSAGGQPMARPSSQPMARPSSQPMARPSSQPLDPNPRQLAGATRLGPLAEPRFRFAAGVLLAVVLGFVPAHFVAAMRERSAYLPIDNKTMADQQLADTPETYAMLDRMRADQLARKETERRSAAIIAFAIWATVGGGLAFVWFRKIPWER